MLNAIQDSEPLEEIFPRLSSSCRGAGSVLFLRNASGIVSGIQPALWKELRIMRQANLYWSTLRKSMNEFCISSLACLVFACLSTCQPLLAQEKNPHAGDAKIAKLGEYQFRLNCAFCHGLGARGGGRGPDLTRANRHGSSDAEVFHNIHDGIAGTAMPAATNGGIGVGMSDEEIWEVVTYIRSVEVKASAQPAGNGEHGKE